MLTFFVVYLSVNLISFGAVLLTKKFSREMLNEDKPLHTPLWWLLIPLGCFKFFYDEGLLKIKIDD